MSPRLASDEDEAVPNRALALWSRVWRPGLRLLLCACVAVASGAGAAWFRSRGKPPRSPAVPVPVQVPEVAPVPALSEAPGQRAPVGGLEVRTAPAGATVRVGGSLYGVAPLSAKALGVGRHPLRITKDGYEEWRGEVTVTAGATATVEARLVRSVGSLVLDTDPPGARVRVGDSNRVADGVPFAVPTGEYVLRVSAPGFPEARRTVEVRRGVTTRERISLRGGRVEIGSTPEGAELWENGKSVGRTPFSAAGVPSGEHRYELVLRDHRSAVVVVRVGDDECARASVVLQPFVGPWPGRSWRMPQLGAVFVWIAPGSFTARRRVGIGGVAESKVTLTEGYWLSDTPVTQQQWEALMGPRAQRVSGSDYPIEAIGWFEAMEYCEKLTDREDLAGRLPPGHVYTLPTEAQWEYACRAGGGAAPSEDVRVSTDFPVPTVPEFMPKRVAQRKANAWGLHDMRESLREYCRDDLTDRKPGEWVDPVGSTSGPRRICRYVSPRGGIDPDGSFARMLVNGEVKVPLIGFRVALVRRPDGMSTDSVGP